MQYLLAVLAFILISDPAQGYSEPDLAPSGLSFLKTLSRKGQKRPGGESWLPKDPLEQIVSLTKPEGLDVDGNAVEKTDRGKMRYQLRILTNATGDTQELRLYAFDKVGPDRYSNFQILVPTGKKTSEWVPFVRLKVNDLIATSIDQNLIRTDSLEENWINNRGDRSRLLKLFDSKGKLYVTLVTSSQSVYPLLKVFADKDFTKESGGTLLFRYLNDGYSDVFGWFKLELIRNGNLWNFSLNEKSGRNPVNLLGILSNFRYIFPVGTYEVGLKEVHFQNLALEDLIKI